MSLPIMSGSLDLIAESYSVLATELESTLSSPKDLYSNVQLNDILALLVNKIDNIKLSYDIDDEQSDELRTLANTSYQTILDAFKTEFPETADAIETEFQDSSNTFLAEVIYKYLYIGRRSLLMTYLVDATLRNRAALAKSYRTPDSKKDITYQAIRSEFPIRNPDYYILLMNYSQICEDILTDENLDIMDIFNNTDLSEDESDALEQLFTGNGVSAIQVIVKSLIESFSYSEFVSSFRLALANEVKHVV
jgi:hypothetical protein